MNIKPIDKSKKSNIKCEHCEGYRRSIGRCEVKGIKVTYWHRCKQFEWSKSKRYKAERTDKE